MNICINGITRSMTEEEEKRFYAERALLPDPTDTDPQATESDYIEALNELGVNADA